MEAELTAGFLTTVNGCYGQPRYLNLGQYIYVLDQGSLDQRKQSKETSQGEQLSREQVQAWNLYIFLKVLKIF